MNIVEQPSQFISRSALAKRWGVSSMTVYRRELMGELKRSHAPTRKPVHYPMDEVLRLGAAQPGEAR